MPANAENGLSRRNAWRLAGWGAAALVLLAPLLAMQVTDAMDWSLFDFAFLGGLLGLVGLGLELAVRRTGAAYRAAAGLALAAAVLLLLINGAVGVMGGEQEAANLLYGGVLAVALLGAAAARLRPAGMARAMVGAALAQGLVPVIALSVGLTSAASAGSVEVLGLTAGLSAMWLLSAWLFRKAAA